MEEINTLLEKVKTLIKYNSKLLEVETSRFNMFKICGVNHYENTHSAIIAELLNVKGTHGFKDKFLQAFIENLKHESIIDDHFNFLYLNTQIYTEYAIADGRIDILITNDESQAIILENKIYAADQFEQLKRYSRFGKQQYKSNYKLLYLTLWGNEASEDSGGSVDYQQISYSETIIKWLNRCVEIAARNAPVRETLIQYINHLKTLTGQDMNKNHNNELIELLSKPENINAAFLIADNFDAVKNHLINKIFLPRLSKVCKELGLINISEEYDRVNTPWSGFRVRNPNWKYFQIATEFEAKGLKNFIIGFNYIDSKRRNDQTFEELKKMMRKSNSNWAWKDFPTYLNWEKDAMLAILERKMEDTFKKEIQIMLENTKNLDM